MNTFMDPQTLVDEFGLTQGMSVADFGAGTGALTVPLARIVGAHGAVYAIEVQKELLATIKKNTEHLESIHVIWGDIERPGATKIADNTVDAVILANTLFQVEDKKGCLNEATRVLKHGGKIIVIDWTDSFGGMGPHVNHIIPVSVVEKMLTDMGYIKVKDIPAGSHHFGIIFRKG